MDEVSCVGDCGGTEVPASSSDMEISYAVNYVFHFWRPKILNQTRYMHQGAFRPQI